MFKLRSDQIETLENDARRRFLDRLMAHLREHHAEIVEPFPEDVLREMAESAVRRAKSHGLTGEASVTAFVGLMFEIAPNFDQHPAVREVLEDGELAPDDRVEELLESVTDDEWEEAHEAYDAGAWFPELPPEGQ
jgi:hypothetical protein